MPMTPPNVSVVLPIRNAEQRIVAEIERVLDALADLTSGRSELIIVDDGSSDSTAELLDEVMARFPQVRVTRNSKPRGIETAGQTGLEKATSEIVFIQEDNRPMRLEDMRRLFRMADDETIVAARAESTPRPLSGAILRRLKAWGAHTAQQLVEQPASLEPTGLQMIRRPHLQRLSGPLGACVEMRSEVFDVTSMV
jgi:glycosyltransferase involved in cell wall biosynthesis